MSRVDVVVGGQRGDEGKGIVAYQISRRNQYDLFVRVGAENAEHRFLDRDGHEWVFHDLPCAVASRQNRYKGEFLLSGATCFSLDMLRKEIEYFKADISPRVMVGENAAIIRPEFLQEGMAAAKVRGSTFLGVGATMAHKVRRHEFKVAKDYAAELEAMGVQLVGPDFYTSLVTTDAHILVEASQGALLSLNFGPFYPYLTSRDVTATAAVAEAGLRWRDIRDVWMVVKTIPTRVPGNSGPAVGKELTWSEVCGQAGRPYEEIEQTVTDTGAGGTERPFRFSFEELEYACALNAPTCLAVTFIDWLNYGDAGVTAWDALSPQSKSFIDRVEECADARVKLIRTGPALDDCIWR